MVFRCIFSFHAVFSPVDIYLVNGRKIKCFSNENPIVVDIKQGIAEYRGVEEKGQLFANRIYDAVVELLNSMKEINYPAV